MPGDVPGNVPGGVTGKLGDVPGKLPSDLVGKLPLIPPFNLRGEPQAIYGAASWGRCWGRRGQLRRRFWDGPFTGRGNLRGGAVYGAGQFMGRGNLRGQNLGGRQFTGQAGQFTGRWPGEIYGAVVRWPSGCVCVCVLYIEGRAAETSEVPTSVCVCVYDFGCKSMERLVACLWRVLERASNKHKHNT